MPSQLQTGRTSVTGSVTVDTGAAAGTVVCLGSTTATSTVTLGTVPASKVWVILAAGVSAACGTASSGASHVAVQANAIDIINCDVEDPTTSGSSSNSNSQSWTYPNCPRLTAGQVLRGSNPNSLATVSYTVQYIQVDA